MSSTRKFYLTEQCVRQLIKEVKKRPCLWNPDDDDYNDRAHITAAWEDMAKILQLPEEILRVKWKNLRDLFKRELKKCNARTADDYTGKWRHFKALWFLRKPDAGEEEYEEPHTEMMKLEPSDTNEEEIFLDEQDPFSDKPKILTDDECDVMFLKSLAPYFRELDPIRKLVVRSKIQDILLNEIAAQAASNNIYMKT